MANPPTLKRKPAAADAPAGWLKSVHYHGDDWTIHPGKSSWISDVGRRTAAGRRVYRQDGVPWGEPSWKVGDEIGLYYGGTLRVPVVVEVTAPPEFNPDLVQEDSHGQELDAGERWPWVTPVLGLHRTELDDAPTLEDLRVDHKQMMRRPKIVLTPTQHHRLLKAFS